MSCFNFSSLCSLPPQQLTLLATLIGLLLADGLNTDDQNALGNFIIQIGQTLATNATLLADKKAQDEIQEKKELISNQIDQLNVQINLLKQQLKKMY